MASRAEDKAVNGAINKTTANAEELKRKRLEAWRKRQLEQKQSFVPAEASQQQPTPRFSSTILTTPNSIHSTLSSLHPSLTSAKQQHQYPEEKSPKNRRGMVQINLTDGITKKTGRKTKLKTKTHVPASVKFLSSLQVADEDDDEISANKRTRLSLLDTTSIAMEPASKISNSGDWQQKQDHSKSSRWDLKESYVEEVDALEQFMKEHIVDEHIRATRNDKLTEKGSESGVLNSTSKTLVDNNVISTTTKTSATAAMVEYLSWKTQMPQEEDKGSLRTSSDDTKNTTVAPIQLSSEMKTEKHRREELLAKLKREVKELASSSTTEDSQRQRLYNDEEGGIMEEAERALDVLTSGQYTDAREVLAELNKKKDLKAIDHSSISYIPINKNLYICPKKLAELTEEEILELRAKLKIKVRGLQVPAPISDFKQAGLSDTVLQVLITKLKIRMDNPFPIQAQCLPVILAGRDCIGIAKTGSGKTLAYLLPMIRHILAQPDLAQNESGPIGLVLVPARELATQIHSVCRMFAKYLGLK
jgi:ATP-dependent RNA helicase DDX46/PRP5